MRWDRGYNSNDIEDRRGEGGGGFGLGGGGGGGFPLGAALALGSRWGWKGIVIALLVVGAITYGGVCTNTCGSAQTPGVLQQTPSSNADQDELAHFVGFVFDDVQKTWHTKLPDY